MRRQPRFQTVICFCAWVVPNSNKHPRLDGLFGQILTYLYPRAGGRPPSQYIWVLPAGGRGYPLSLVFKPVRARCWPFASLGARWFRFLMFSVGVVCGLCVRCGGGFVCPIDMRLVLVVRAELVLVAFGGFVFPLLCLAPCVGRPTEQSNEIPHLNPNKKRTQTVKTNETTAPMRKWQNSIRKLLAFK